MRSSRGIRSEKSQGKAPPPVRHIPEQGSWESSQVSAVFCIPTCDLASLLTKLEGEKAVAHYQWLCNMLLILVIADPRGPGGKLFWFIILYGKDCFWLTYIHPEVIYLFKSRWNHPLRKARHVLKAIISKKLNRGTEKWIAFLGIFSPRSFNCLLFFVNFGRRDLQLIPRPVRVSIEYLMRQDGHGARGDML